MSEEVYTITNPWKFMTEDFFIEKLINLGFPKEVVSIKVTKKDQMAFEVELYFKIPEIGTKFYNKYNGKLFGFQNYKLNIIKGKTNKKLNENNKNEKEITYSDNYESWIDTHYMRKINEEGLILVNPQQKEIQKIMIKNIIHIIKTPYIKGHNIINYLFPIIAYDKRTLLQVFAYELREAPYIINKINYILDPVEKLKNMTSFLISQIYLSPLRIKPFNPLLGETFQIKIGNLNCYFEQSMINPPTTNIYCFDTDGLYKIYGYISLHIKTGINNCKVLKKGNLYIEYTNGQKYKIYYPSYYIGGVTIGKRSFNVRDSSLIIDETNRLVSFIKFYNKNKNYNNIYPDEFEGNLISINEIKIDNKGAKHLILEEDTIPLAKFDGEWTNELRFGNKIYWKRNKNNLYKLYESGYKLKSDSSLRPDLKLYNENNLKLAENTFYELHKKQIKDFKLRNNYKK